MHIETMKYTCKFNINFWKFLEKLNKGDFLDFFMYFIQHCFILRPLDSIMSEDAGLEPQELLQL